MFFHGSYMFSSPLDIPSLEIRPESVKNYDFVEIHVPEMRKNFPNKKCVLIHKMLNFDPIDEKSLEPFGWNNFFALKIDLSSRIKRTPENEEELKKFCDLIPIKKILVYYDREWERFTHKGVIVSKIICENDFLGSSIWGNLPTIRKPKELNLEPKEEFWIIFSGYEGKYYGEYPNDTLKKYKTYFESFEARFYISWYIESPSVIKLTRENCVSKMIEKFKALNESSST